MFAGVPDSQLLNYGVPAVWLDDVRQAADEDALLALADHLPADATEALLELATGSTPERLFCGSTDGDPFAHPDAERRFRVMSNQEELAPGARISVGEVDGISAPGSTAGGGTELPRLGACVGSAGTGKTMVALHRAVHLARTHSDAGVLLTTFSTALADALRARVVRLIANEPKIAERLEVHAMADIGRQLYQAHFGRPDLATPDRVRELLRQAAAEVEDLRFSLRFLWTEWSRVVDAWQLASWEQYRDVPRLGRRTRLPERQRELLWSVFSKVAAALDEHGLLTEPRLFGRLERQLAKMAHPPFEFCVVDEAQDIGVAELRFLAALGAGRPDALFFAGDLGQRIFQTPFSWRALGVDIRGRSHTLRVNYRTSHQIRRQADRLLPPETSDVDGNTDRRTGTVSVFNGAEPVIQVLPSHDAETAAIAEWLKSRGQEGYAPHEMGVFVRSKAELDRAIAPTTSAATATSTSPHAVEGAGYSAVDLAQHAGGVSGNVAVGTMDLVVKDQLNNANNASRRSLATAQRYPTVFGTSSSGASWRSIVSPQSCTCLT